MTEPYTAIAIRTAWQQTALCEDISVTYYWFDQAGSVLLCRAMREAGKPDGPMTFEDEAGNRLTIASIHQWADHQPTYQARYRFPRDAATLPWYRCGEVRIEMEHYENGLVKLCRAMKAAGLPDGDMQLIEATPRHAKQSYIPSIHRYAEYRLVSVAAEIALSAKTAPQNQPTPAAKPIASKQISADWYRLLVDLKDGKTASWNAAHHLTRAAIVANGYVTDVTVTDAGRTAMALYENPPTYTDMTPVELAEIATTIGLVVNGNATQLADILGAIDTAIVHRSLDEVEHMAVRFGLPTRYGKGKKGDSLKKRIMLTAILNAGHSIEAV